MIPEAVGRFVPDCGCHFLNERIPVPYPAWSQTWSYGPLLIAWGCDVAQGPSRFWILETNLAEERPTVVLSNHVMNY